MPYNSITSRTDAQALIPEDVISEVIGKATEQSAVLQMFRHVPVSSNVGRIPILSALPQAYWVNGDTGLKQTTQLAWKNKFLYIEELAVIMPVANNVLDDAKYNIWDNAMPLLTEAMARAFDSAIIFGINAPGTFPQAVVPAAIAAGNIVVEGLAPASGGFMGDLDATIGKLEDDGYEPDGAIAARSAKSRFRSARNTQGDRLDSDRINGQLAEVDGMPIAYTMRGLWPTGGSAGTNPRLVMGEFGSEFVVGVRKDVTMDTSTDAVIQDNTGAIQYNLFQQDMTAVRLTFRGGWQVANVINYDQPTEASRYPASVLAY